MILKNHNKRFLFLAICIWNLLFLHSNSFAQSQELSFNHLSTANGLSNNSVLSINQDAEGFLWFGTSYGLNRFDGRTFKIFTNDPHDKTTISSSNFIKRLELGTDKQMWLVYNGLDLYHPEDNTFENIIPKKEGILNVMRDSNGNLWIGSVYDLRFKAVNSEKIIPIKIAKNDIEVTAFFEDKEHHIWVGTSNGLYELFFTNKKLNLKRHLGSLFRKDENIGVITNIVQDDNSKYWIGTKKGGLYLFDKKTLKITRFLKNTNDKNSLVNNIIYKILKHKNGTLWIGTQDGLSILNPNTHQFTNYQQDPTNPNSLSNNTIFDIFEDKNGSVWIGTFFGGVNVVYSAKKSPFSIYQKNSSKNSISGNVITAITEDSNHNLWIGTDGAGLNYFDRSSQQFHTYKNNNGDKNNISSNLIKAIAIDKNQNIWIGTALGGLNFFNPKTSTFTVFKQDANKNNNFPSENINCLIINRQNKVFIGTDSGLNIYDISQQKFSTIDKNRTINALFEDKKGTIWAGTISGIYIYCGSELKHQTFKDSTDTPFTYDINCFLQDSKGNMWVGTSHNGLVLLDLNNHTFKSFKTKDGLPNDNILAIKEDKDDNLWISTDNGLAKYNLNLKTFRSFNTLDGLPDNQFNINSGLKDKQGRLFFGTYNGLVSFIPQNIEKNEIAPNVVLSNLKLFNIPVKINDESGILKKDINFSKSITFNHDQNIFTIEFSALNFIKSSKNKYAYKLQGLEKKWNYVDIPSATYSNLPAGKYQFLVKASNNDGIWNKNIKRIEIIILPPIWKTWWAYLIYFIIIFSAAYYAFKFFKARADLKQELHFEKMKLDFFTNVSHEIRTPLTLILGPIEKLEKLTKENTQANKYALSIKNNTERLYRLVNELLDFRKAGSGYMRLYVFEEDIVSFLKKIFDSFQSLAEAKNINYDFKSSSPQILVYFDRNQMEKVFFNLLSNAFKFTQNGGSISLEIILSNQQVEITVTDKGKGICINNIDDVFNNFYQAEQSLGTGIGLALSKSLVELHKGKINVSSRPATEGKTGKTTFKVALQLGKNHLSENDLAPSPYIGNLIYQETNNSVQEEESFVDSPNNAIQNKKNSILIVEDNDEVRDFIKNSLENEYNVYESENGLEGWNKAIQIYPDLIISDVMMPVMDGLELCKKIKSDISTSHIPVIMLTAKSAPIHQIQGLQQGADAYITKPFNDQILQLNIRNLLSLRASLQKKYSEQLLTLPIITNSESSQEEVFLQKLQQIIEGNIDNPDLDVSFITSEIGMSKSLLYMKFSALTNLSLTDFIKTQRLKQAVAIFQKGETDVLSVAMQVGFNNTKYFSSEFKKIYGITPNEYVKNKRDSKN